MYSIIKTWSNWDSIKREWIADVAEMDVAIEHAKELQHRFPMTGFYVQPKGTPIVGYEEFDRDVR